MNVKGIATRTIRIDPRNDRDVIVIDQRCLPFELVEVSLASVEDVAHAIASMTVRGAPLIGVTAAYGMYLATLGVSSDEDIRAAIADASRLLKATRPTAVNLAWSVDKVASAIAAVNSEEASASARRCADAIAEEEVERCRRIGEFGVDIILGLSASKGGEPVNILTHCNAGWLACVDHGTATSPIYAAHDRGIRVHVWVDETRPRNQGGRLTSWELQQHGVPHTLIVDNASGHLMQRGLVDMVIVGSDRMTATGDVCNKIGTYPTALAAHDNAVPFYAALPSSTIDWTMRDGIAEIPIEQRDGDEVRSAEGLLDGSVVIVAMYAKETPVANFAFDVTPARLITGIITERGICDASEPSLRAMFGKQLRSQPYNG